MEWIMLKCLQEELEENNILEDKSIKCPYCGESYYMIEDDCYACMSCSKNFNC